MSIADMFRNAMGNRNTPQAAQGGQAVQAGQAGQAGQVVQVQPSAAPGGNNNPANLVKVTGAPGATGSQEGNQNQIQNLDKQAPMAEFANMWEVPDPSKVQADPGKFNRPKLDYAKVNEGFSKFNFAQGISPEAITKALNGDAQVFMEILNQVGRSAVATSFQASERYSGQILDQYDQSINARIPREVGKLETSQLMRANLKSLNHPAVTPILDVIQNQMQQKYPDASPQEIADAAQKYMQQMAQLITNQSESDENSQQRQGGTRPKGGVITDFSNFELDTRQQSRH